MKKRNSERLEESVLKKYSKRDKRRKPKMKVSGKSVLKLQRIIEKKIE